MDIKGDILVEKIYEKKQFFKFTGRLGVSQMICIHSIPLDMS